MLDIICIFASSDNVFTYFTHTHARMHAHTRMHTTMCHYYSNSNDRFFEYKQNFGMEEYIYMFNERTLERCVTKI